MRVVEEVLGGGAFQDVWEEETSVVGGIVSNWRIVIFRVAVNEKGKWVVIKLNESGSGSGNGNGNGYDYVLETRSMEL